MGKPRLQDKVTGEDVLRIIETNDADKGEIGKRRILRKNIFISPIGVSIPHGLGVLPQGWIVTRLRGNATSLYPREIEVNKTHLKLASDPGVTCDVMIW